MFKKITVIGLLSLLLIMLAVAPAAAHNGGIYPANNIVDAMKGDYNDYLISEGTVKSLIVVHGHGFEYDFGDITTPLDVIVVAPDGTKSTLRTQSVTENVDNIMLGTKEPLTYQKTAYNFTQKGTYFVYTYLEEDGTTEILKTAIFVGDATWNDWNKNLGLPLEFTTYTRMAGIAEGDTMYARLNYGNGTGASDIRYYVEPVKSAAEAKEMYDMLVSDFPTGESIYLIYSKRASTDSSGNLVSSIPEKGVWTLVASATIDGESYKATYVFPVLPQIYGSDADTHASGNNNGIIYALIAVAGILAIVCAVLIIRKK